MKAKRRVVVLVVLAVLIPALWAAVRAADKTDGNAPQPKLIMPKDTLRGLQGVAVAVEGLEPEVEQLGLTSGALRTDTERQLRQYGIKVLSHQEQLATPGMPCLYVNVNVKGAETVLPIMAVSIQVELQQHVSLERDPTIHCVAGTWKTAGVGTVSRSKLGQVRDSVRDLVARFINDYLAVNPKKGKAQEEAAERKP